jgi:hypothetical protein
VEALLSQAFSRLSHNHHNGGCAIHPNIYTLSDYTTVLRLCLIADHSIPASNLITNAA